MNFLKLSGTVNISTRVRSKLGQIRNTDYQFVTELLSEILILIDWKLSPPAKYCGRLPGCDDNIVMGQHGAWTNQNQTGQWWQLRNWVFFYIKSLKLLHSNAYT